VFGNIRTAKLKIADGVVFEGKCEMIRNPQALNVFSGSGEQLEKSAQTS
jgi:cytoskeletal protein CcmA (bactofilin family)